MVPGSRQVITLAYRAAIPMALAAGARIECTQGRLWITGRDWPGDVVLEAGQSHEIPLGGETIVQALRQARFSIHAAQAPCPAPRPPAHPVKVFPAARAKSPTPA